MILGGAGLFLLGHAAFKATVWRVVPRARLAGIAVLAALGALTGHASRLGGAVAAGVVVLGVAVHDQFVYPRPDSGRR